MDIIAVWNKEAIQHLTDASPNWLQTLQRSIPEAVWEKNQYLAKEASRTQTTSPTMFVPSTSIQKERTSLARKEAKKLTFTSNHGTISSLNWSAPTGNCGHTDGSCIGKAKNFTGAGVYCPQTKAECYVDSGGVGMTNTINRAELTGIAAALTNNIARLQRTVHAP